MTDLERVREALRTDEIDCAKDPVACIHADAQADLDTHLKEDAEREAELTRLRDENEKLRDYQTEKYDEVVDQRDTLLAALRFVAQLPDGEADELRDYARAAISEVEGTKGGPSAQGR